MDAGIDRDVRIHAETLFGPAPVDPAEKIMLPRNPSRRVRLSSSECDLECRGGRDRDDHRAGRSLATESRHLVFRAGPLGDDACQFRSRPQPGGHFEDAVRCLPTRKGRLSHLRDPIEFDQRDTFAPLPQVRTQGCGQRALAGGLRPGDDDQRERTGDVRIGQRVDSVSAVLGQVTGMAMGNGWRTGSKPGSLSGTRYRRIRSVEYAGVA